LLPFLLGCLICAVLLVCLADKAPSAHASPLARPLSDIISDAIEITHTSATTHEMQVWGDGNITRQFISYDGNPAGRNQVDQDGNDPEATMIAIMFDQHSATGNVVDVGAQGEFAPVTPITLFTAPDNTYPGYSEDSQVVYASGVLSYQVEQRTFATTTNNCVIMELDVRNVGGVMLTNGKLLYMVDVDAAHYEYSDMSYYDPERRLLYSTDYNSSSELAGFAMGISLLEGSWRGYGAVGDSYPSSDIDLRSEMLTPTNSITNGYNNVLWLVTDIPDLDPDQTTMMAFGLCAKNAPSEDQSAASMKESFDKQASLSVLKTATPAAGNSVLAGEPITYRVTISNSGYRYVDNIVLTDVVPMGTDLITYGVSQGAIVAAERVVTATVGRLYPASDTVTVTLAVAPPLTSTDGQVITNQAFIKSEPIIKSTNRVTHRIRLPVYTPILTLTKGIDTHWAKRIKLTFTNTARAGDLKDFPVLVMLDSSRIDYAQTQDAGQDLRFVDADGETVLPHEIEEWNEYGTSYVWVKVPQIDGGSNSDHIWMYYGNPIASDSQVPENVWDASYRGVWHLGEAGDGSPAEYIDSTSNNNHGQGGGGNADQLPTQDTGAIGYGQDFGVGQTITTTEDFIDCGSDSSLDILDEVAVSAWVSVRDPSSTHDNGYRRIVSKKPEWYQDGYGMEINPAEGYLTMLGGGRDLGRAENINWDTNWHYLAGTISGTTATLYFDGVDRTDNSTVDSPSVSTETLRIGALGETERDYFYGVIDEVRVADTARSSDWISAQYESMIDRFITYGSQEDAEAVSGPLIFGAPFTYTITVTNTGRVSATNVVVTDSLPGGARYISGGTLVGGDTVSWTLPAVPVHESVEALFTVSACQSMLLNKDYRVVTSTEGVDSASGRPLLTFLEPPTLTAAFVRSPTTPTVSSSVAFTSASATNGGPIVDWAWDFGDGHADRGFTTNHSYTSTGIYTVRLTITDTCGFADTTTDTLRIYAPDLNLAKTAAHSSPLQPGDLITYTIVVSNSGRGDAAGVAISDTTPLHSNFVADSVSLSPLGAGAVGTEPPLLARDVYIGAGERVTVTFAVTISAPLSVGTMIINTAAVTSTEVLTSSTDTVTSAVTGADLSIAKNSSPKPAVPGEAITYTITVSNPGKSHVADVIVADDFPVDIVDISWVCGGSSGGFCAASGDGDIRDAITLPVGSAVTYIASGNLITSAADTLVNTATVSVPVGVTDLITINNRAVDVNNLASLESDLAIAKLSSPDPVARGEILTYTLIYTNHGPFDAEFVAITDTLPADVAYGGVVRSLLPPPTQAGQRIAWRVPELTAGASGSVIFTVTVNAETGTSITNSVVITSATRDPNLDDNENQEVTTIRVPPVIAKEAIDLNGFPLYPRDEIEYQVGLTNVSSYEQREVLIADPMPANTTLVPGSLVCSPGATCRVIRDNISATMGVVRPCDFGGMVVASVNVLSPGDVLTLTFRVLVDDGVSTIGENVAVAEVQGENPRESEPVYPPGGGLVESGLVVFKEARDLNGTPLHAGEIIKYDIAVTNTNATYVQHNVVISDPMPTGVTLLTGSVTCSSGATCSESDGVITATVGSLSSGDALTLTFHVTIDEDVPLGGNMATVRSDDQNERETDLVYPPGSEIPITFIYLPIVARNWGVGPFIYLPFVARGYPDNSGGSSMLRR